MLCLLQCLCQVSSSVATDDVHIYIYIFYTVTKTFMDLLWGRSYLIICFLFFLSVDTGSFFFSDLPDLCVAPFLHPSPGASRVVGLPGSLLVPVSFLTCHTCFLIVPSLDCSAGASWVLGLPGPAGELRQEAGVLCHSGAHSSHGGSRSQAGETALFLHASSL